MPSNLKEILLKCGCGCGGCPCCPGWPLELSAIIHWFSSILEPNDCEPIAPSIIQIDGDFGCPGQVDDPLGTGIRIVGTYLFVRVFCDGDNVWHAQYRSAISGGTFEPPVSSEWAEAEDVEFSCPSCGDAGENGIATGSIDFIAKMACETSGGVIVYDVLVHGDVEVGCL